MSGGHSPWAVGLALQIMGWGGCFFAAGFLYTLASGGTIWDKSAARVLTPGEVIGHATVMALIGSVLIWSGRRAWRLQDAHDKDR